MLNISVRPHIDARITTGMRVCLHVLQVTRGELRTLVGDAVDENPCLEEVPSEDGGVRHAVSREPIDMDGFAAPEPSLLENLLAQLRDTWLSTVDRRAAVCILGNLDNDGFLDATIEEIALLAAVDGACVERVLACVQGFDPPGIAARDRSESFVLQLRRLGYPDDALPMRIVREHLSALVRKPLERIAEAVGAPLDEVRAAARLIARLDPSPGRQTSDPPARVVPDVRVEEVDGQLVVMVNDEGLPRLRLCKVAHGVPGATGWRQDAKSLIWALEQRRDTLHAVTSSIVRAQREFLAGRARPQPLVLRDVAAEVGRHESTVSRAIADKYIETPRGIFPLRAFFARRVAGDGATTAGRVKDRIAQIVAGEDHARPLTDDQIVERLAAQQVRVARRTVGKYREELGVPSAALRRWGASGAIGTDESGA